MLYYCPDCGDYYVIEYDGDIVCYNYIEAIILFKMQDAVEKACGCRERASP